MSNQLARPPTVSHTGPFFSASAPGIGRVVNEDMIGTFDERIAWVLDGADDPLADTNTCQHGAAWYVTSLNDTLVRSASEDVPSLTHLLARAIQRVRDSHEAQCDNPGHRKASAAVALLSCASESLDYLVLGDASILLESSDQVIQVTDQRLHHIAQDARQAISDRLRQGHGYDDPLWSAGIRKLVQEEQRARNRANGYPIAAYDPSAAFDSLAGTIPMNNSESAVNRIVLMSDGTERAVSLFDLYPDWRHFMKATSEQGLGECIARIRKAELSDPTGSKFPRTKFSDDASVVIWNSPSNLS